MKQNKSLKPISLESNSYIFNILLILLAFFSLYIVRAYLGLFFSALIITIVFNPLYQWLQKKVKKTTIAALLTTLILIILVLLPLILTLALAVSQALTLFNSLQETYNINDSSLPYLTNLANQLSVNTSMELNDLFNNTNSNFSQLINNAFSVISSLLFKNLLPLITYSVQAIAQTVFFFIFLVYLFPSRSKMFTALSNISPLNPIDHSRFITRFEAVTAGTMKSLVYIGIVQGFLGGLMLSILSVDGAAFWGLLIAVSSLIPLGSGVVWIPMSLYLILSHQWLSGIILFLWGAIVISSVDNIIRVKFLCRGEAQLPEIVTLLSVLGGINTFGFWGFVYGPAIIGLFYTGITIFQERRQLKLNHIL